MISSIRGAGVWLARFCGGFVLANALVTSGIPAHAQPQGGTSTGSAAQGTTAKKRPATASTSSYDRLLLKPALLKAKAPEQYKVKFVTTRGEFTISVTRAWAPLLARPRAHRHP